METSTLPSISENPTTRHRCVFPEETLNLDEMSLILESEIFEMCRKAGKKEPIFGGISVSESASDPEPDAESPAFSPPEALEAAGAKGTRSMTPWPLWTRSTVAPSNRSPVWQGNCLGSRAMTWGAADSTIALRLKSMCTIRAGNLSPRLRPSSPSPSMCSGGKWYWLIVPVKNVRNETATRARARTLFQPQLPLVCQGAEHAASGRHRGCAGGPHCWITRQSRDARLCLNLRHDHVDWRSCRKQRVAGTRHLIEWKETLGIL